MKTSHFSENYDLCHPILGCENSNNNNKSTIANSYGHPSTSRVVAYGKSSTEQTSNYEKNANEFQIKQQQRQQQQEQNKKRKRETGEYSFEIYTKILVYSLFCVSFPCPLFLLHFSSNVLKNVVKL